jgi:hypothetical protein
MNNDLFVEKMTAFLCNLNSSSIRGHDAVLFLNQSSFDLQVFDVLPDEPCSKFTLPTLNIYT